jgi:phosphotransferase system enzyme I (PtsI)
MTARSEIEARIGARGIALGRAHRLAAQSFVVEKGRIAAGAVAAEIVRWRGALALARRDVKRLRARLAGPLKHELGELIDAHRLILDDPELEQAVAARIRGTRVRATAALKSHRDELARAFAAIEDEYLGARIEDVDQVMARLNAALVGETAFRGSRRGLAGRVLVCDSIGPAELERWHRRGVIAVVATQGSPYSHSAIVARALELPLLCGASGALDTIREGAELLVDAESGRVIVAPDPLDRLRLRGIERAERATRRAQSRFRSALTRTRDRVRIDLWVNAEQPDDVALARRLGVDGIGLFRTEFLFQQRAAAPDEETQYRAYRSAVSHMAGKPVTLRTLDFGADKRGAGEFAVADEPNPALGLRGVRLTLARRLAFRTQLRAMLRASVHGPVRILLPMLSSGEEIDAVRRLISDCRAELAREGVRPARSLPLGGMIEVPAAALIADSLAPALDFLAIGSNDLVQYTLAADRNNAAVSPHYDPLHPAVLRLIALTVTAARKAGRSVSLCGEVAADPGYLPLLLALGLTEFSVHPRAVLAVRERLAELSRRELLALAPRLTRADRREQIAALLKRTG